MAREDFERHFSQMGLSALPPDVSCEATFAPNLDDQTLASSPRDQVEAALDPTRAGTLPRLALAMPDAARGPGVNDEAELIPVQVLGEGGMGRVLLARQQSLGREVAVKVLKANSTNQGAADALVEEARTAGSLEHPGIVPVYALARDSNGLPALVMKRVEGVSWADLVDNPAHQAWDRVAQGRDRLEAHVDVLIQVCNAVAHAHGRGVIHRDLKPANVLLGELGEVYVADWGVAIQSRAIVPGPPRLVGTPAFLAPEMVTGDPRLMNERTDVYLLGATLYQVLTGRPLHGGSGLKQVLELAWVSAPPEFPAEVPGELAKICTRAVAADPVQRFPTAIALRDALRRFLVQRGSALLGEVALQRLALLETAAPQKGSEADQRRWYALISECRFGFGQALEANAENERARAGLERCLEVAARHELLGGTSGAARAFVAEMKQPPVDLLRAIEAIEQQEAQQAQLSAKVAEFNHQMDPSVAARERVWVGAILALAILGVTGVISLGGGLALIERYGLIARMVPLTLLCLIYGLSLFVGRRALLSTRINRQLAVVFGLSLGLTVISRGLSVYGALPLNEALARDALLTGAMLCVCAVTMHSHFGFAGLVFIVGSGCCVIWPSAAAPIYGGAGVAGLAVMVLAYKRGRRTLALGPQ